MLYRLCSICNSKVQVGTKCKCEIERDRKRTKKYDKNIRKSCDNIQYYNFYHSKAWERLSKHIANKYNNLCVRCLIEDNEAISYSVIHHIYEIKTVKGWEHKFDADYLIPLCHDCHNKLDYDYTEDKMNELINILREYEKKYI